MGIIIPEPANSCKISVWPKRDPFCMYFLRIITIHKWQPSNSTNLKELNQHPYIHVLSDMYSYFLAVLCDTALPFRHNCVTIFYLFKPIHTHSNPFKSIHIHSNPFIPIHTHSNTFIPIHTHLISVFSGAALPFRHNCVTYSYQFKPIQTHSRLFNCHCLYNQLKQVWYRHPSTNAMYKRKKHSVKLYIKLYFSILFHHLFEQRFHI